MVIQFCRGDSWQAVLNESRRRKDLSAGSRSQETAGEDTSRLEKA
jgi:hypothetical protein